MFNHKWKMFKAIINLMIFLICIFFTMIYQANADELPVEYRVLNMAMSNDDKMVFILQDIKKLSAQEQINAYVMLTRYYLGELGTEILLENATNLSEKIVPFLVDEKNSKLICEDKYQKLCVENDRERNRKIDEIVGAINRRIILFVEYPPGLEKIANKDIATINIFIKDYRKAKNALPQSLSDLREYTWQSYGYSLRIVDPWGSNYIYRVAEQDQYELKTEGEH